MRNVIRILREVAQTHEHWGDHLSCALLLVLLTTEPQDAILKIGEGQLELINMVLIKTGLMNKAPF